jgi:hypothetical protein
MSEIKPRLFTCRRCGATLGVKTPDKLALSATVYTTEPTPITCNVCNMRTFWRPIVDLHLQQPKPSDDLQLLPPLPLTNNGG